MTWQQKIGRIRELADGNMTVVLFAGLTPKGAPAEFLDELRKRWPFLPDSYVTFLSVTDGAQFDLFVLFGSGRSPYPAIFPENDRRERDERTSGIAIGEDASGGEFVILPNGIIQILRSDPPEPPDTVAANFDDLLDQVMLGPRYHSFFGKARKHTDWGDFLRKEGWAPS